MPDIMGLLETIDGKGLSELFAHMEEGEHRMISARDSNLLYRYLGEVDCPEEMFFNFATAEDVRKCGGKTNWFICSDGSFFTCSDCAVDSLFESGKIVNYEFPFESERNEKYYTLSNEERIAFRVKLQGISEAEAKEIVCYELCLPAYENIYEFSVKEILLDSSNNSEEVKTYTQYIEADTEKEAKEKFASMSHKVGSIVCSGTRFTEEDNKKMRESGRIFGYNGGTPYTITLKSRVLTLVGVKKASIN